MRERRTRARDEKGHIHCFCWMSAGDTRLVFAISEDGCQLSSDAVVAPVDDNLQKHMMYAIGIGNRLAFHHHRRYRRKYPNGYDMTWYPGDTWRSNPRVLKAFRKGFNEVGSHGTPEERKMIYESDEKRVAVIDDRAYIVKDLPWQKKQRSPVLSKPQGSAPPTTSPSSQKPSTSPPKSECGGSGPEST